MAEPDRGQFADPSQGFDRHCDRMEIGNQIEYRHHEEDLLSLNGLNAGESTQV